MNIQQTAFKFPKALYLSFFVIDFKLITYLNMKFPWNVAIFVLWLIMWFILSYSLGSRKYKISITGLMSRCWQGWSFLEALGKNPFLCLLQLLFVTYILWLADPFSIFSLTPSIFKSLSDSLTPATAIASPSQMVTLLTLSLIILIIKYNFQNSRT